MKLRIITAIIIFILYAPAWSAESVYIDVRSQQEYSQGHIEGALLMPYDQIAQLIQQLNLAKDTPIIVYCRSGRRADIAREKLLELNYTNVTNAGGYEQLANTLQKDCTAEAC